MFKIDILEILHSNAGGFFQNCIAIIGKFYIQMLEVSLFWVKLHDFEENLELFSWSLQLNAGLSHV